MDKVTFCHIRTYLREGDDGWYACCGLWRPPTHPDQDDDPTFEKLVGPFGTEEEAKKILVTKVRSAVVEATRDFMEQEPDTSLTWEDAATCPPQLTEKGERIN